MAKLVARHGQHTTTESAGSISRRGASYRTKLGVLLSAIFLLAPGLAMRSQQQPAPQTTIPVEVKVVNVLATVRKKKGEIVRNLTKDDFALEEDGRPQTIRYFAQETDLPLTLGLLVDTSGSQRRVLDQEQSASSTFLDQVLRVDKDQAFVIHFDREVELLQDLTSSRLKLDAALQSLTTPQLNRQGGQGGQGDGSDSSDSQSDSRQGSHRRGGGGGGTLLYDAVYLASNELTAKQKGRKALIVLSDGVDRGSKETLASAIEAAQRADTLVYSVLFKAEQEYGNGGYGGRGGGMGGRGGMGRHGGGGRYPQESRPDGKKILERISKETGGRLFEVSKKEPIEQIYDSVQEELRNEYSLGYTPNPPNTGPGYHKITLTTKPKDLIVQTRDGYYVPAPPATTK
ncbi:MAG: VWA domain-containing protein [Terriglobia bacterium]